MITTMKLVKTNKQQTNKQQTNNKQQTTNNKQQTNKQLRSLGIELTKDSVSASFIARRLNHGHIQ